MSDNHHYNPDEITVPDGCSLDDLDWIGVSWSTCSSEDAQSSRFVYQYLLAPGILSVRVRQIFDKENPFTPGSMIGHPFLYTHSEEADLCELAQEKTLFMLEEENHIWDVKPFLVDFTEDELNLRTKAVACSLYPDTIINNLGDALGCGVRSALAMIYDQVARKRSTQNTVLAS